MGSTKRLILPKDISSVLKCDLCRGYMSVPPISMFDGKNSCGRCDPGWPRNTVYEELAQFMIFPCTYCDELLTWGSVEKHETECKKNVILCPSRKKCKTQAVSRYREYHKECQINRVVCPFEYCYVMYEISDIVQHFTKFHKDYVLTNNVEARKILKEEKVWNFTPENNVCLVLYKQAPLLLFVHSDADFETETGNIAFYNYYFGVFSLCREKSDMKYIATMSLSSESECSTSVMKNQEVKSFDGKMHCIDFLKSGPHKCPNSLNFMTTKFEKLKRSENLRLSYTINILDCPDCSSTKKYNETLAINPNIFSKILECPICKEYMCPPIFNCNAGHTICKSCKDQMALCPFCKATISYSRNFILEDLLETLQINCQNEPKGCAFVGCTEKIKLHEITCRYN
ncbi:unnamed protein product [Acanthoscelides obtectus]|uniref:RING-type domain-containing protein n=1 Tax=Acanthoscelides obtectus TaxID=200917 RepID=A0A9P0JSI0_ACAOB|nr:unnamed protein product [Acanthoscelides obtectus]CAK1663684.1 E3 ubiquitin-protein ligase SIAH1B [Acanthoscelides obtectus]